MSLALQPIGGLFADLKIPEPPIDPPSKKETVEEEWDRDDLDQMLKIAGSKSVEYFVQEQMCQATADCAEELAKAWNNKNKAEIGHIFGQYVNKRMIEHLHAKLSDTQYKSDRDYLNEVIR